MSNKPVYKYRTADGEVLDVDDSDVDEALKMGLKPVALLVNDKGEEVYADSSEINEAFKAGFRVPVAQIANSKGKIPDGEKRQFSKVESAALGASQGMTFGFGDELGGFIGSLIDTPAEAINGGGFHPIDNYRANRDRIRASTEESAKQNPVTHSAAELISGLAVPVGTGAVAAARAPSLLRAAGKGALVGAELGAVSGLGTSEADLLKGEFKQAGKDLSVGAALGAGVGAIASPAVEVLAKVAKNGVGIFRGKGGIIENLSKVLPDALNELKQDASFRGVIAKATGKSADSMTDNEIAKFVGNELMQPGPSPVKDYLANMVATEKGNVSPKALNEAFELGSEGRNAARNFDVNAQREHAQVVADKMRPVLDEYDATRKMLRGELEDAAGKEFAKTNPTVPPPPPGKPVFQGEAPGAFDEPVRIAQQPPKKDVAENIRAFADDIIGEDSIIPVRNQKEIEKALAIIDRGSGVKGANKVYRVGEGQWNAVSGEEKYRRLQAARQLIDEQRSFFAKEGMSSAERVMNQFRSEIDDVLKTSQSKIESDELWSKTQKALDNLESAMEFRSPSGERDLDVGKIKRSWANTDQGVRAQDAVDTFRTVAEEHGLGSLQTREDAIGAWREGLNKVKDRQKLDAIGENWRSAREVGALEPGEGVQRLLTDPVNYLQKLDAALKTPNLEKLLAPEQLRELVKYRMWVSNEIRKRSAGQWAKDDGAKFATDAIKLGMGLGLGKIIRDIISGGFQGE